MSKHVAIVGGGVVGLATAYALVREGHGVSLCDSHAQVAQETSFANGGQLSYRYVSPLADAGVPLKALAWMLQGDAAPLKFHLRLEPRQWRWCLSFLAACRSSVNRRNAGHLLRLALHSQHVLGQWRAQDGLGDFAWRRNGKLVVYRHAASLRQAAAKLSEAAGQRLLDTAQCLTLEPALAGMGGQLAGGIYSADDEVADCLRFCQVLEQRLQASGRYRRLGGSPVTGFELANGRIRALRLGQKCLAADAFVLAAGNRSAGLARSLGLHLPIYPLKGYSLTLPLAQDAIAPEVSVTDFDHKVVYARLDRQFRVAAMVDIGARDAQPSARRLSALRRLGERTFPHAGDYRQAEAWAGLRPCTPQGTPLLGATTLGNLWLNSGHGSLGFTLACASGQILSELISGRASPISLEGLSLPQCHSR
ncbi:D-amino acid dehydrogenase [Pseudomonas sp. SP16.1]|uniref:D-amino acid dehydrogenase n=1 Tax=Pseudomonas sp. SP16.1 TaxID=3458854 RepID=UPI004045A212